MATDREILKQSQASAVGSTAITDARDAVAKAHRQVFCVALTDENDADGTATNGGIYLPMAGKVVAAYATTEIAVTAHATNYATFVLEKGTVASPTTIASFATDTVATDDMVAGTAKSMTITDSAAEFAAGTVLRAKVTKAASGVAIATATATTVHNAMAYVTFVVEWI